MGRYDKYQQHFLKNIRKRLEEWETVEEIAHQDVYRLLHAIAGTAAMIGMNDIDNYARKLMEQWGEDEQKKMGGKRSERAAHSAFSTLLRTSNWRRGIK